MLIRIKLDCDEFLFNEVKEGYFRYQPETTAVILSRFYKGSSDIKVKISRKYRYGDIKEICRQIYDKEKEFVNQHQQN